MKAFITYAHRGASAVAPENTMAAFRQALDMGADGIECDIQLSRDGVPVIIHDEFLERTTNGWGWVSRYTVQELKGLDAGSWFHPKYKGETIPTLEEFLQWAANTPLLINLEIKPNRLESTKIVDIVVDLIKQFKLKDRTVVSSYDLKILERIRQIDPKVETALLFFYMYEPWKYAEAVGARSLHIFHPFLTREAVDSAHRRGLAVIPYTVDEWEDIRKCIRSRVDGIITNYPNRVQKFLNYIRSKGTNLN